MVLFKLPKGIHVPFTLMICSLLSTRFALLFWRNYIFMNQAWWFIEHYHIWGSATVYGLFQSDSLLFFWGGGGALTVKLLMCCHVGFSWEIGT